MKEINVVFSTNNKFAYGLCVALYSLLENNQKYRLNVHILYSSLSAYNLSKFEELQTYYKNSVINPLKVDGKLFKDLPLMAWYSVETYYRYILADVLPKVDRVLYIDVDTLIIDDIYELYSIDLSEYYVAGVNPEWKINNSLYADHMKNLGIGKNDLYINAGVTLMNLEKIRTDNMVGKLFENTKKYKKHIKMVDQDVINMTFKGKIKEIDSKYNFRMPAMVQTPEQLENAKILHFTEAIKPWDSHRFDARVFFAKWYQYEYGYNRLVGALHKKPYKDRSDLAQQALTKEKDELISQVSLLTEEQAKLRHQPKRGSFSPKRLAKGVVRKVKNMLDPQ